MAIETASTLSGLSATIQTVNTTQSNIVVFMAFKPLNNANTWNREVSLQYSGATYPRVLLRMRADGAFEGIGTNAGNSSNTASSISAPVTGNWHRVAIRCRAADRLYIRCQGDASMSQSSLADTSPMPGSNPFNRFVVNTKFDASTFGEAARYAHFGYYLGDWTDQQIADFCAGTWNPANSSLVTNYWTGDSLTPEVGTGTLAQVGSNNATIVTDTAHGVPAYAGSDTQPPNVPTVSAGAVTLSSLAFSWGAVSDNGGGSVAGYNVRVLDASDQVVAGPVNIGNVLTYTVTGLTHPATRKLQVNAYDNASPANTSGWSTAVSSATIHRKFEFVLNQVDGAGTITVAANKTNLWWAWWPSVAEVRTAAPTASGTGATTNGSGVFSVTAPGATSVGANQGFIIVSSQDAVPDAAEQIFAGPIDVI